MRTRLSLCVAIGCLGAAVAMVAADPPPATTASDLPANVAEARWRGFERDALPTLRSYCSECHGVGAEDGRWSYERYDDYSDLTADREVWTKVRQYLDYRVMPPADERAPTDAERQALVAAIDAAVFFVDPDCPDPGPTALRRLNRAEYDNSVREALGVETRPARNFPEDDSGYGFDNVGDALTVSPLHAEKYLIAAREVAAEAMRLTPPPRAGRELPAGDLVVFAGDPVRDERAIVLRSFGDEAGTSLEIPIDGVYRVAMRAATVASPEGKPWSLEILCDGRPVAEATPEARFAGRPGPSSAVEALVDLEAGVRRIALRLKGEADGERSPKEDSRESGDGASDGLASIAFLAVNGPFSPEPLQPSRFLAEATGGRPLEPPLLKLSGEDLEGGSGRTSLDTGRAWFASNGYRRAGIRLRESGLYRLRVKVGAQQVGDEPVRFEVRLAGRTLGPLDVTAAAQAEQWIEVETRLPAGTHDLQVWFVNESIDPETGEERRLWLHELTLSGPLSVAVDLSRKEALAQALLAGRRLFRRPLSRRETEKIEALLNGEMASGASPRGALQVTLEALLASPEFLFLPTPEPGGPSADGSAPIDEFALASRLSFFLWSSGPDDELLALAERGELRKRLASQVARMLDAPQAVALTENFAGQWLQLRNLEHVAPDPETYPDFDAALAGEMRRETELLFEHVLRENRPATELLDADYTFVTARLAEHYGLEAPEGEGFQRVSLVGGPRRGLVTHASILALTSLPTRTSPVKRGKWILEQLLGSEPPPAPPDVPPLKATPEDTTQPLRVRLEQHSSSPACASCHAALDPFGFALENYDAVGRWRASEGDRRIDASGRFLTGETFADWTEARAILLRDRREEFVRCVAENLLTYALGRGLTYRDRPAVDTILVRCESSDYGLRDLVAAVIESVPFDRMRIEDAAAVESTEGGSG